MQLAGKYSAYAKPFLPGVEKAKIQLKSAKQAGKIPSLLSSMGQAPMSYALSPMRLMEAAGGGNI
jgi:hypothetical protein